MQASSALEDDTYEYVKKHGRVKTGSAAITNGKFGKLKCKYVIHAVGPTAFGRVDEKDESNLRTAIEKVFELAEENKVESLAIPAVSSGIFGFPKKRCAEIMVGVAVKWLDKMKDKSCIKEVRFTNIDSHTCEFFLKEVQKLIKKK